MGLGIAIDVAVATVSRFRDPSMTFSSWTLPVAVAHILLPALGYYSWWGLGQLFVILTLPLGLLAFALISIFVYEAFCEWIDAEPKVTLGPLVDRLFSSLPAASKGRAVMILAVSMDALWSGPAKAAQAASGDWSWVLVLVSFVIAGAVVAGVAEISLLVATGLRRLNFRNMRALARYLVAAKFLEATILFAFGVLSLWNAFGHWIGLGSLWISALASAGVMTVAWVLHLPRLTAAQLRELSEQRTVLPQV
ncbi:MAG: hypothetical protein ABL957_05515 [Parvularculaceae bacterium]